MRIAICDGDGEFSKELKRKLYAYSNINRYQFLVETFSSGEELLKSQNRYVLIFIEYKLNGINGLETARILRRRGNNCKIIFLTACTHFVFEAFQVEAHRFITKPLNDTTLINTLDETFKSITDNNPLFISVGNDTICLNTEEIFYLEADNKYCNIHLNSRTVQCKKTMARAFEALPKSRFQKINRAFVVNLNHVDKYNNDRVFLKNGEELHITRTYYKNFKQNYIDYSCPIIL